MAPKQSATTIQQLKALEKLGGMQFHPEDDIVFQGNKLILPEGTSIDRNIEVLIDFKDELAAQVKYGRTYNYRPWDVAYVAIRALKEHFGMTSQRGSFLSPPALIDVQVDVGKVVQVPWGVFQIPQLPNVKFTFGDDRNDYGVVGYISASGPKRDAAAVQGVFQLVEEALALNSIYKGKAIDGQTMPNFIDVRSLDPAQIVYSQEVQDELEASLFAPLRWPEAHKALGLPLKRSVLLSGPFGTGKTLALKWASKIAVEADRPWTSIMVRPGRDNIEDALRTARAYAPSLVAFEDVDTVAGASQESERISQMLDLFDGMDAKGQDIMVVLTTNYAESLHKGMLRPGRLDAIIPIGAPDAQGIERLVKANTPTDKLDGQIDWAQVSESMRGYLPAFVVETAGRAIRHALVRSEGQLNGTVLTTEDLVKAGNGMRPHFELQQDAKTGHEEPELDRAVKHLVALAIEGKLDPRVLVED